MIKGPLTFVAGTAFGLALTPLALQSSPPPQGSQSVGQFPDLRKGLMETPGCVGVQAFTVDSGRKAVISAWFENRKAMAAWYYSPMHQQAMAKFFPNMGGKGKK